MLPVVKPEIRASLSQSLKDKDWVYKVTSILDKENPVISSLLASFVVKWTQDNSEEDAMTMIMSGLMVYALLRSQDEADELSKLFGE